ncbi:MAG: hypothetical protein ACO1N4_05340 [Pedobacter sp.]
MATIVLLYAAIFLLKLLLNLTGFKNLQGSIKQMHQKVFSLPSGLFPKANTKNAYTLQKIKLYLKK